MTATEQERTAAAICKAVCAIGCAPKDELEILAILEHLAPYDAETVCKALARLAHRESYFPSVAKIVAEIRSIRGEDSESAWGKAVSLTHVDPWLVRPILDHDPALREAVAAVGGLARIRNRLVSDEPRLRARFASAYESAVTGSLWRLRSEQVNFAILEALPDYQGSNAKGAS